MAKKKQVKAKQKKKEPKQYTKKLTANATIIAGIMARQNVRGNFKDYVLLSQSNIIDWKGTHSMATMDGKLISIDGVALVHKRRLKFFLPTDIAERFWHPRLGRIGALVG